MMDLPVASQDCKDCATHGGDVRDGDVAAGSDDSFVGGMLGVIGYANCLRYRYPPRFPTSSGSCDDPVTEAPFLKCAQAPSRDLVMTLWRCPDKSSEQCVVVASRIRSFSEIFEAICKICTR